MRAKRERWQRLALRRMAARINAVPDAYRWAAALAAGVCIVEAWGRARAREWWGS